MLILIGIAFLFFLFLTPYYLYDGVQIAYFLHPFHMAQADFLCRDWYVTQTAAPHPFFGAVISLFHSLNALPQSLFLIHISQYLLLVIAVLYLVKTFSNDTRVFLLACFFLLFYFSDGLGQSSLLTSVVQATDIASIIYLFSFTSLLRGKILNSFIFLGLSGLFHVHFAIDGLLLMLIFVLLRRKTLNLKETAFGFIFFLILSGCNLIPVFQDFSFREPVDSPEIFKVFFNFRSPHHYRPSTFELAHVFRALFPLFFLFRAKDKVLSEKPFANLQACTMISLSFCFLAVLSTEFFYCPFIARLFFFRLSPCLLLIGLVFLAIHLVGQLDKKNFRGVFLVFLTFVIILLEKDSRLFILLSLPLSLSWALQLSTNPRNESRKTAAVSGLFAVTIVLFLLSHRASDLLLNTGMSLLLLILLNRKAERLPSQIILSLLIFGIPALGYHFLYPERVRFYFHGAPFSADLSGIEPAQLQALQWIRSNTEKNAVLLTPPDAGGIRFFAERAIVVDFHANPYSAGELGEWKKRLESVTQTSGLENWPPNDNSPDGQQRFLRQRYLKLKASDVEKIGRKFGADYFFTETAFSQKEALVALGCPVVFENPRYLVFKLKEPQQ